MRLAISTSPSRVSSEMVPILRMYMRTGSPVPAEPSASSSSLASTFASTSASSSSSASSSGAALSFAGASMISMPSSANADSQSSI